MEFGGFSEIYLGHKEKYYILLVLRVFLWDSRMRSLSPAAIPPFARTLYTSPPDGAISTRLDIRTLNTYQHLMSLKEDIGRDIGSERGHGRTYSFSLPFGSRFARRSLVYLRPVRAGLAFQSVPRNGPYGRLPRTTRTDFSTHVCTNSTHDFFI